MRKSNSILRPYRVFSPRNRRLVVHVPAAGDATEARLVAMESNPRIARLSGVKAVAA